MEGFLITPSEQYYSYIIGNEIPRDLRLEQFLEFHQFDLEHYAPLQFYFRIKSISNETFFVLTHYLNEMIGFARIELNRQRT